MTCFDYLWFTLSSEVANTEHKQVPRTSRRMGKSKEAPKKMKLGFGFKIKLPIIDEQILLSMLRKYPKNHISISKNPLIFKDSLEFFVTAKDGVLFRQMPPSHGWIIEEAKEVPWWMD